MNNEITEYDIKMLDTRCIPCPHCAFKFTNVRKDFDKYIITCECGFMRISVQNRMELKKYL